jgi:uncharacterized lipoprotein YmbA
MSGSPVKHDYYLLRSDTPGEILRQMNPEGIILTHVSVATYLNEAGLVLETSDGKINTAELHLWAEPLRHSLRQFLADEITAAAGKDIYVNSNGLTSPAAEISININQLHGTHDGNALLVASWAVHIKTDNKAGKTAYQFSKKAPLQADGYDALVAAEKLLLKDLATEIAESL